MGDYMKLQKILLPAIIASVLLLSLFSAPSAIPAFREDGTELIILMYHGVLKNPSRSGKYVITPQKFEEDLIYLEDKGYKTVTAKQIVQYVYADGTLPEKSVLITFDDGMYNNAEYILPILQKHNAHAVFSIVGSYTDEYSESGITNPAYSYLKWSDVNELADSGHVEFGNHSYAFHTIKGARNGSAKNKNESEFEYIESFYTDTQKMQSEFFSNCNFHPFIYTYPFGSVSRESSRVLRKMGFLITLSCTEGINRIYRDEDCLYLMKRFNRDGRPSTQQFFKKILQE